MKAITTEIPSCQVCLCLCQTDKNYDRPQIQPLTPVTEDKSYTQQKTSIRYAVTVRPKSCL